MQDPQSLHKYLYVHGDPVNGVDPTGRLLVGGGALAGALIGGQMRSQHGAAVGAVLGATGIKLGVLALTWLNRRNTPDGTPQYPLARYQNALVANHQSVTIQSSALTADQVFQRIAEFRPDDYSNSPAVPSGGPVNTVGDKISWNMRLPFGLGQRPFDVAINQIDHSNRLVSVVTLMGHPLSGFRFWRVIAANGNSHDFTIETGAIEHNTLGNDWFKANVGMDLGGWIGGGRAGLNGNDGVLNTWRSLLNSVVDDAGGTIIDDQIDGHWDNSRLQEFAGIVQFKYGDCPLCNP